MNWTPSRIAAAIAALGFIGSFSGTAQAGCGTPGGGECIYIDASASTASTGDGITDIFDFLGFTGTLGTSIYTPGLGNGSAVLDTNIPSMLQAYGVLAGTNSYTAADGTSTVSLNGTPGRPEVNIDALGNLDNLSDDVAGFESAGGWGINVEYMLNGSIVTSGGAPVANYTSGFFDLYFDDLNVAGLYDTQLLRANITGSTLTGTALELTGTVSYDWDGTPGNDCVAGTLCAEFFNFNDTGVAFFDEGSTVTFTLDTTVIPASPTLDQLAVTTGTGSQSGNTYWTRQTGLNGQAQFGIPEPGTLALLGIGLLGAARMRRKA